MVAICFGLRNLHALWDDTIVNTIGQQHTYKSIQIIIMFIFLLKSISSIIGTPVN